MTKPKAGEALAVSLGKKKPRVSVSKKSPTKKKRTTPAKAKQAPTTKPPHGIDPTDFLGKSIVITSSDALGRKIKIVENISSRSKEKKPAYTPVGTPSLAEFKTRIHLALASPFKLNFDHSQLASNVARYAGTAFAVVGAFLTMYNMNAALSFVDVSSRSLPAQTTTCLPGTYCPPSDTASGGGAPAGSIDETPDVDISLESSSATIAGTVRIYATVILANRIDLYAKSRETSQSHIIGTMTRNDNLVWEAYWQTAAFDDGEYSLKAVVTNQYGTYVEEDSTGYLVQNHPIEEVQPLPTEPVNPNNESDDAPDDTNTTTVATTTATQAPAPTVTTPPSVRVEIQMEEPLRDDPIIRTFVPGASSVRHYIRPSGTTQFTTLGSATLHSASGGEWRYRFDTTRQSDGDYDVRTQALFPNNTSSVRMLERLTIDNAAPDLEPTDNEEPPEEALPQNELEEPGSKIYFEFTKQNPMTGIVDVYMQTADASFVELYLRPEGSLTLKYLGLGIKQSEDAWKYRFDTTRVPNGKYGFVAKVRSQYGDSTSEPVPVVVENRIETEPVKVETQTYIDTLKSVGDEVDALFEKTDTADVDSTFSVTEREESPMQESEYAELAEEIGDDYTVEVTVLMDDFTEELTRVMHDFGRAMRVGDEEKARALLGELEILRDEVVRSLPYGEDKSEVLEKIRNHIETMIKDMRERTEKSETLIKERVGDASVKDSDNDGVSDYDEVNLYGTDPMSADTDKDGFIDGVEILNGYDPKDSAREANVMFESPKEQGIVREDILEVTYMTTVIDELDGEDQVKAHIGGKALPNSFVTLYIFSTPIIMTLKTDDEGNWSYIFDKELEDGEHEIYVGMTDNAGKIVAKSNPLPFVKTAQAFTPVDALGAVANVEPIEPSLVGERALLAIASIAIVALGLVLILLGLHVRPKEEVPQFA
jgi:Bacterial Ig-like domain/Bacterial TSP3 repeat